MLRTTEVTLYLTPWQTCSIKHHLGVSVVSVCSYPEEVVDVEDVEIPLLLDVEETEEILQRLRLLAVLQRQHKVQVRLIVLDQTAGG